MTFDVVGVEALLSDIEVCPGEFANASAARALNLIDNAKVEHNTIVVADLARRMQDIVVLTCCRSLTDPTSKGMLCRSFTAAFGCEIDLGKKGRLLNARWQVLERNSLKKRGAVDARKGGLSRLWPLRWIFTISLRWIFTICMR